MCDVVWRFAPTLWNHALLWRKGLLDNSRTSREVPKTQTSLIKGSSKSAGSSCFGIWVQHGRSKDSNELSRRRFPPPPKALNNHQQYDDTSQAAWNPASTFPEETHGEPGSGLKPSNFIEDALRLPRSRRSATTSTSRRATRAGSSPRTCSRPRCSRRSSAVWATWSASARC